MNAGQWSLWLADSTIAPNCGARSAQFEVIERLFRQARLEGAIWAHAARSAVVVNKMRVSPHWLKTSRSGGVKPPPKRLPISHPCGDTRRLLILRMILTPVTCSRLARAVHLWRSMSEARKRTGKRGSGREG